MSMHYEDYMKQIVQPMREELTQAGVKELTTEADVEAFMNEVTGTTLVVVNSVCGCAAGLARPAAVSSLNHEVTPDQIVTVFAGQDKEATAKMRTYFEGYPPSSPSMALLKGKEVVHFIPREEIEDRSLEEILENITTSYDKYCK
ncbi:BrxA/BrxB family bacilliredoxin [Desertibacillus haloalkaliphilus]|uniref:BrxA/BrxB family bacilliredoxin n=1 Tax=Desertibacillus haloalkaliphilus TaxID=1328930 RepID=UPI001C26107F|nr:BrxA/BrxB family bacilliredoxin [Desertibacillus haloalkaliphilus]MBU8907313.1 BrxA/BrxB family bacilliredoxin [Desertibacillus haloalkaliphilus]